MTDWFATLPDILARLPADPTSDRVVYPIRHGTMRVGVYAPRGVDSQSPHDQDELYIVAAGKGSFVKNGEVHQVGPGDLIFVEAGADHRFQDFTADFVTWVVFWGPAGGESERDAG